MNTSRALITFAVFLGSATAAFAGCSGDDPSGGAGGSGASGSTTSSTASSSAASSGSGGMGATCGDGKLDVGEACDDGNDADHDGCTACTVDECHQCTAEAGQPSICIVAEAGAPCQSTKLCDGHGACVECTADAQCKGGYCHQNVCLRCDDMSKNGDETDTDCGGAHCAKCADGKACGSGDDCSSGFCVDGVCCVEACDGACVACNIPGSEGVCDFVAKYDEDTSPTAGNCSLADGKACNGGGLCAFTLGQTCTGPAQCASLKCGDPDGDGVKTCVKAAGEACGDHADCASNNCDPSTMKCL